VAIRGFTLIELLAAALIASIFLAATAGIVIQVMRLDREETGRTEVQAELTQAMEFIQRDISEALYIYNDSYGPPANPGEPPTVGADGILDLNQFLFDPGWIKRPPNSIPVVAFWKLNPIPRACYTPTGVLQATPPTGVTQDQWNSLRSRGNIYSLVAYYLRRNYNNAGNPDNATLWEGNARMTRYELRPFNGNCTQRNNFFVRDPDPFGAGFIDWPRPQAGQPAQLPAQDNDASNPIVVMSNIFSSRENRSQAVNPLNAADLNAFCPSDDPVNPYVLGGAKPASATFTGVPNGQADSSFYVCVRRSATSNLPQDVIINLRGISMERANPGLFRRYISGDTTISEEEISRYLHTIRTQVLARGAINRQA